MIRFAWPKGVTRKRIEARSSSPGGTAAAGWDMHQRMEKTAIDPPCKHLVVRNDRSYADAMMTTLQLAAA